MPPLRLTSTSGPIRVVAEARADVLVERGEDRSEGAVREIRGGSSGATVRVPPGTDLVVGTRSGRVDASGERFGSVRVTSEGGRVTVGRCTELDVRTGAGRIEVDDVEGSTRIRTSSGRIVVGRVGGPLRVDSNSGRVEIGEALGTVDATTVDGRVTIGVSGAEAVCCESVSGRIDVTVPAGVTPLPAMRTVSGRCTCEVPEGPAPEITARTVSGRIRIRGRDRDG